MKLKFTHSELIERKNKLQTVATALKERFIGNDHVIDEVINLLMPWYLFPEAQLRPTVINLWGLTGSGKTALVQSIVEMLDHRKLYTHIDMGEFESDSASWMKNIFTEDLEFFHQKSAIICLDEFQFARTLDANNNELGKDKLRVIWDILDSGKIDYIPGSSTYYLYRADACITKIDKAIKNGVTIEHGEVAAEAEMFLQIFETFYFESYERCNVPINKSYFLSSDFIEGLYCLFDHDEFSKNYIRDKIKASTLAELREFIIEGMKTRPATKELDLSHSVIFVLGNLDEAYPMSSSMNPDISADEFYEATTHITIANIKSALRRRFRSEQIARLGNNHVIYRSFNNAHFRVLIQRELESFGWKIDFDSSVIDVVYAEGVFPSQGTRPVFTTIKNLIESRIGKLVMEILEKDLPADVVHWYYAEEYFLLEICNANGKYIYSFLDAVNLKIDSLRKTINSSTQAHTGIHEAGHAVLAALTLRIIPSVVVSKTASDDGEGFCMINFPDGPMTKDTIRKDIILTLGGYAAEKLIFGEEHTSSGVRHDIETATELANRAIRQYAMGIDPVLIVASSSDNADSFYHTERYSQEALRIIKDCLTQAELILNRNKLLLLKMGEYLTTHARMEEAMIAEYVRKYSIEEWVRTEGFVRKEDYYSFDRNVQQQIRALEKAAQLQTAVEMV
ncbi:MAG TPA: hypothetical protein VIN08_22495 [Ohtaekwangia sp.]|uniref:hypothetical protein n=1 Tax=Ohtaekwangia sp. TaxID=2066019 RepID=UPI002F92B4FB